MPSAAVPSSETVRRHPAPQQFPISAVSKLKPTGMAQKERKDRNTKYQYYLQD